MFAVRDRRAGAITVALLLAIVVAGCGGGERDSGGAPATVGGVFPVTIEHRYGSTEILAPPERVVTVGLTDHDTVLALGITPVALTDWFGDQPNGVWPWAQIELGAAQPVLLDSEEMSFERIAAADPDLILGVSSGLTQQQYDTLSRIAPTVAQSGEYANFGTPWQHQTRIIGTALGRADRAQQRIDEVEAQFAAARDANPGFTGATGVIALIGESGNYYPYGPADARAQFLSSLGFEQPPEIARLAGNRFFATISAERFGLLNADVLVWTAESQAQIDELRASPVYQTQPVVAEGRDVFLPPNGALGAALSYNNVLSLPFAIEGMVPLLQAAVDGDPSTNVPSG